MTEKNKLEIAIEFAFKAHEGQKRKYSGIPYITHPLAVMEIVSSVDHDEDMLIAAILHDTVEDTNTTIEDIAYEFGNHVAFLVDALTDISKPSDGNRAIRKAIDRKRLADAIPRVKTIKLADLIHNSYSIVNNDPKFAEVYMREKKLLLVALNGGDSDLLEQAESIVNNYLLCLQIKQRA